MDNQQLVCNAVKLFKVRMSRMFSLLAWTICLAPLLAAAEEPRVPLIRGVGADSCGQWQEMKQSDALRSGEVQWLLGYVSAYSRFQLHGDIANVATDNKVLVDYVDKYCATNPLNSVEDAARELFAALALRNAFPGTELVVPKK